MRRKAGFSLLECVLVAVVVSLLAALAVPGLTLAVRRTREGRALTNLRTLTAAQATYYSGHGHFALPAQLFTSGCLPPGTFQRPRPSPGGGSPTEALSDGTYEYSLRYATGALGITVDADPRRQHTALYRRFRIRLGRVARGRAGGEGVMLVAEPSKASPPSTAYRVLGT